MKFKIAVIIVILSVGLTGCRELAKVSRHFYGYKGALKKNTVEQQAPILPTVENTDLAKMILKPKREHPTIERDPFQPFISGKGGSLKSELIIFNNKEETVLKNLTFLGVIKIGNSYSALLQNDLKKGKKEIFSVSDKINNLTITEIEEDHVVLKSETGNYTLKRGNK